MINVWIISNGQLEADFIEEALLESELNLKIEKIFSHEHFLTTLSLNQNHQHLLITSLQFKCFHPTKEYEEIDKKHKECEVERNGVVCVDEFLKAFPDSKVLLHHSLDNKYATAQLGMKDKRIISVRNIYAFPIISWVKQNLGGRLC